MSDVDALARWYCQLEELDRRGDAYLAQWRAAAGEALEGIRVLEEQLGGREKIDAMVVEQGLARMAALRDRER